MNDGINIGLEGVVVAATAISNVEGAEGRLSYRGVDIAAWARRPYIEVIFNLVLGYEPTQIECERLTQFLLVQGELSDVERKVLSHLPKSLHPMLMLQAMIPLLDLRPVEELESAKDLPQLTQGFIIAAKIPTLIANWYHLQKGEQCVDYPGDNNFHANFLRQFNQRPPTELEVKTLDAVQILQLEHGMNAGTFAGRVVASTQAPIQSAIAASIGALFGKLHGGADQAAVEMAKAIGAPENAESYVKQQLADKQKIMGMGHREYKVVDPRATLLKPMARELCQRPEHKNLLQTLEAVETVCRQHFAAQGKDIWANVEFYKGAVFQALGIPPEYFTALFAMARVNGYIAHFLEFNQGPRLIRPQASYIEKKSLNNS